MSGPFGEPWTFETFTEGAETTAVWSVINLTEVFESARMDSEHYRPSFVSTEAKVRALDYELLGQMAGYVNRGTQPTYSEVGEIPVLRTVNIREKGLTDTRREFVTQEFFDANPRGQVSQDDVLITSTGVGTLGRVTCNYEASPYFADGHITIVRDFKLSNPQYVATFLQSQVGYALIERRQRGSSGQIEIYPDDIASIPIPLLPEGIQEEIATMQSRARELRWRSQTLYAEAEALLLDALGLDIVLDEDTEAEAEAPLTYTQSATRAWSARRLDAEYFQPRYQRAMEQMAQSGKNIGDVARLAKRRFAPKPNHPFHYIEIGDVGQYGRAESNLVPGEEAPSRAQWIVREGDVITSTVRPIRRLSALIEPEQDGYVCTSGFAVLDPTTIEPEVLLVYLRLPIVCEILDLHTSASMYPAISTSDLLTIPVAIAPEDVRAEVVECIQASHTARQEAHRLLEAAKARVEALVLEGNA